MKETIQQTLKRRLAQYQGSQSRIARDCNIAQATVNRIARGDSNPRVDIAQLIFDWLDREDAKRIAEARAVVRRADAKLSKRGVNVGRSVEAASAPL